MRVGIVINSSWNIYNFRLGLLKSLQQHDCQVVAIAPDDGYAGKLREAGCEFYDLKMTGKGTNPAEDLQLIRSLYRIYQQAKLDVVLQYTVKPNIYGTIAARLLGIPSVNNVTGLGTVFIRNTFSSRIARLLYRLTFRFPRKVFFQNSDDRQLFIDQKLVRPEITDVLPGSGIDLSHFLPSENIDNQEFTFLMVARVLYDKGILEYIAAVKKLRAKNIPAKFLLLGKIEDDNRLGVPQETVENWEKEGLIEYLGTREDVRPVMAAADCIVLPSYREGTPRTLLEAACLGKPVITTDVPGCRETVLDGYNGFLCRVKDPEDLAKKMEQLFRTGSEERREMGKNSRALAEQKFDEQIVIRKYRNELGLSSEGRINEELRLSRKKLSEQLLRIG